MAFEWRKQLSNVIVNAILNVILHIQTYKKTSIKEDRSQHAPKFYDSYTTLKLVGLVAYKLFFPSHSKLNRFFDVFFLKKVNETKWQFQTSLPELDEEGSIWL
jgi:hypothetical protein